MASIWLTRKIYVDQPVNIIGSVLSTLYSLSVFLKRKNHFRSSVWSPVVTWTTSLPIIISIYFKLRTTSLPKVGYPNSVGTYYSNRLGVWTEFFSNSSKGIPGWSPRPKTSMGQTDLVRGRGGSGATELKVWMNFRSRRSVWPIPKLGLLCLTHTWIGYFRSIGLFRLAHTQSRVCSFWPISNLSSVSPGPYPGFGLFGSLMKSCLNSSIESENTLKGILSKICCQQLRLVFSAIHS